MQLALELTGTEQVLPEVVELPFSEWERAVEEQGREAPLFTSGCGPIAPVLAVEGWEASPKRRPLVSFSSICAICSTGRLGFWSDFRDEALAFGGLDVGPLDAPDCLPRGACFGVDGDPFWACPRLGYEQ
jgi:hypothetical protein